MLAFINSPIEIALLFAVLLLFFGPNKLPEIGQQLGRALRELRRTTEEFKNSINLDEPVHHDSTYNPTRYDSYGNNYEAYQSPDYSVSSGGDDDPTAVIENAGQQALPPAEQPRGDFAAAALSDSTSDFSGAAPMGVETPSYAAPASTVEKRTNPEGTVPRKG